MERQRAATADLAWKQFMDVAIEEAETGRLEGGIPIGSVLVKDGRVVGRGHNRRVQDGDPTSHAEIDCLRRTGRLGTFRDAILFSTLMPCYLCAGAAVQFGIKTVVVGESENFEGAEGLMVSKGIRVINMDSDVCKEMMRKFIKEEPRLWNEDIGL